MSVEQRLAVQAVEDDLKAGAFVRARAFMAAREAARSAVPSANRGLKSPSVEEVLAIIDFLTFTAPWAAMFRGLGRHLVRGIEVDGLAGAQYRAYANEGDEVAQVAGRNCSSLRRSQARAWLSRASGAAFVISTTITFAC